MRCVADPEHHRHQNKRNHKFGNEGYNHALHARQSSRVIDRGMREWFANEQRDCKYAGNCANELRDDIEHRVPILHFSKTPKSKSHRWIKMSTGPFPERREDQSNRSAAHRDPRQHTSCEFAGDKIQNWRTRVMQQDREQPGRYHEQTKLSPFTHVFWPMLPQRSQHVHWSVERLIHYK